METQLSLEKFDFFKTSKNNPPKDNVPMTIGEIIGKVFILSSVFIVISLSVDLHFTLERVDEMSRNVAKAMTSENMEQELKKMDKNLVVTKDGKTVSYSFTTNVSEKILSRKRIYNFEIQQDKEIKSLVWKDRRINRTDFSIEDFKNVLKNQNINEIKTNINTKTGLEVISFKIENK